MTWMVKKNSILRIAAAFAFGVAFAPVWDWYVARLDDGSDEPLGLIALGLAVYFIWRDKERINPTVCGVYAAIALVIAYAVLFPNLLPMIRGLIAIGVVVSALGLIRINPGAVVLLVLSLPVVASLQFYAGYPLRVMVAATTAGLLDIVGLDVVREGTMLEWEGRLVGVDAACSGVKMLWVGLALAALLAASSSMKVIKTGLFLAVAGLLVITANIVRGFLLFFKASGAVNLPEWTHAGIGLVCFAGFAFLMLWLSSGYFQSKQERAT